MNMLLIQRILQQYGHTVTAISQPQKGYRNESYAVTLPNELKLNLILYKREPGIVQRIKNANRVADFLASHGFLARQTYDDRITLLKNNDYERYGALYRYLPGTTIPWEAYTMEHIKLLGATMSDMHALLAPLAKDKLPSVVEEYAALAKRMQSYFDKKEVQAALAAKLNVKTSLFNTPLKSYARLGAPQALHMDFVRGNILFNNEPTITGILDFEKAAWGPISFDIARTLAFLIVDCKYKEESKVRKYFLHSGYDKRGQNSFTPTPPFEHLVDFFLLHDFYKFLRHNPYESLGQNEHFVRTRDFLLKRNILARTKMLQ